MPETTSASASDKVTPVRARRASRPKVKTGCNNCKTRRVKCDETRPQCTKCVRSGRHCDGYPAYKRTGEITIPIAPRPQEFASTSSSQPSTSAIAPGATHIKPILVRRPPTRAIQKSRPTPPPTPVTKQVRIVSPTPTFYRPDGFAFDTQEGQYFQLFRTRTANELSGFFDSEFWTRSVLQESHSEASIRHAVVALGALYKTLEKAGESPPGSPESHDPFDSAPNHYNFAFQQYGKSLKRLWESLENKESRSQRTVLMSIVLFTCFQSFIGDHKAAIKQIQSGLSLLEERRQESRQPLVQRQEDVVEDELIQMFTRLAVQAKSYDMAFHFPHPYVIQLSPNTRDDPMSPTSPSSPSDAASVSSLEFIPEIFTTSKEARGALDSLCERIMRFNEQLSSFNPGPNNILPRHLQSRGAGFRLQLQQWSIAFGPLLETRKNRSVTITERAGIDVLKMIQLMSTILFLMGFSTSEMDFDGFIPQFKEIVELAKEVVVDEELSLAAQRCGDLSNCRHRQHNATTNFQNEFPGMASHLPVGFREEDGYSHIKPSFALDLGIVPPLFVVATKCRDRKLRREAIRLLASSPRREGMWDSILCAKVSQWIMEVEEDGMRYFEMWDPMAINEKVGEEKRVMVKEILFDLQQREATIRCGTRGAKEEDLDEKARETKISW
jgi:hypothetical protein